MGDLQRLRVSSPGLEPAASVRCEWAQRAVLDRVDLGCVAALVRNDQDSSSAHRARSADEVTPRERLPGAVEPETVGDRPAPVRDQRDKVVVVEPSPDVRHERIGIDEVRVARRCDGKVEPVAEPAALAAPDQEEAEVRPLGSPLAVDADNYQLSAGRERGLQDGAVEGRKTATLASGGRDGIGVSFFQQVGVRTFVTQEADAPVRRPEDLCYLESRFAHSARPAASHPGDPRAVELVAHAVAVQPPVHSRDPARHRVLFIPDEKTLFSGRRNQRDATPVGRPLRRPHTAFEGRGLLRLSSTQRQNPGLGAPRPVRQKEQPAAVGGEAGTRVGGSRCRELLRPAPPVAHAPQS